MKPNWILALLGSFALSLAQADTPPARAINSQTYNGAGTTPITSTTGTGVDAGKTGLDVKLINSAPVNQGNPNTPANGWFSKVTDGANTAAVKAASTAPTILDPALVVGISPNSPITVTSIPPTNTSIAGNITAACATGVGCVAGSTVQITTDGFTTLGFETHGTWNAALTQDVSYDPVCETAPNSALWYQTASISTITNESTLLNTFGSADNNEPWILNIASAQCARIRATSYTSGTVNVTLSAGVGTAMTYSVSVGNVQAGQADQGGPVKVGGRYNSVLPILLDGNRGDLQLDSSSRLIIAPLTSSSIVSVGNISGIVSLPTNAAQETGGNLASIATNQTNGSAKTQRVDGAGNVVPAMDIASRAGFQKVTDGTNTMAVKAASTAAAAADPSAVVAFSPNTPMPAGTNTLGSINNILGTVSLPTGAATSGNQTNGTQKSQVVDSVGNIMPVGDVASRGEFVKPTDGTNSQSYTAAGEAKVLVTPLTNSSVVKAQLQDNAGAAITLGQKTSANSFPMVLASDQSNVPSNVTQFGGNNVVTGTGISGAGIPRMTVSNDSQIKPWDGINTITVKAGSTAAAVGDTSQVVAFSPNTPLPAGTNILGALSANQSVNLNQVGGSGITLGQKTMSASLPFTLSSDQSGINSFLDKNSSGTITALNGAVSIATNGMSVVTINISGTWSATLPFEASNDGGVTYPFSITASVDATGALASAATANNFFKAAIGGYTHFRVRASSFTSGTANIVLNVGTGSHLERVYQNNAASLLSTSWLNDGSGNSIASQNISASNWIQTTTPSSGTSGSAAPVRTMQVGGSDGTNLRALLVDGGGQLQTSLGNTIGKSKVMQSGSLTTTTTNTDQVIQTYTVTTGKTFYLEYVDVEGYMTALPGGAGAYLGSESLESPAGTKLLTEFFSEAANLSFNHASYSFSEPIPISSGTVIRCVTTPAAVTSTVWLCNFGGYEK